MSQPIDRALTYLEDRLRGSPLAFRLVVGTRVLLAVGFVPTGMVKLLGRPFTVMDPSEGLGLFFHALHQSGAYWQFLGAAQILAGVLVLIPATATLGAALFFPIILNIFVITLSMDFHGTPVVTGAMLLASSLLLVWDYSRWRGVLFASPPRATESTVPVPLSRLELACYTVGLVCGLAFFSGIRGAPLPLAWAFLALATLAGLAAVVLGLVAALRHRAS